MMSGSNSETEVKTNIVKKFNVEDADPTMLKNIRCTNCSKYFSPKIFLCPKGHNMCTNCKPASSFDQSVFGSVFGEASNIASGNQIVNPLATLTNAPFGTSQPRATSNGPFGLSQPQTTNVQSQASTNGPFGTSQLQTTNAPFGVSQSQASTNGLFGVSQLNGSTNFTFGASQPQTTNAPSVSQSQASTNSTSGASQPQFVSQNPYTTVILNRSSNDRTMRKSKTQNMFSSSTNTAEQEQAYIMDICYCWICKTLIPKNAARRNVAKEKSLKILDFPCGNKDNGCQFRDKLHQIEEHEKLCIYKERSCFFENCEWNGTTYAITDHLHKHTVIQLNKVENLVQGKNVHSILFDSTFFLLKTNYVPCHTLAFSLLCPANSAQYKYEICFMGYNDDVFIGLSNYCETLMNENAEIDDPQSEYISIPFDFFKNFLVDVEKIRFKISTIKIE